MTCTPVPFTTYLATSTTHTWAPSTATHTATSWGTSTLSYAVTNGPKTICGPRSKTITIIGAKKPPLTIGYTAATTIPVTSTVLVPTTTITEAGQETTLFSTSITTTTSQHAYYTVSLSNFPPPATSLIVTCVPTATITGPITYPVISSSSSTYLTTTTIPVRLTTTTVYPTGTGYIPCPEEKRDLQYTEEPPVRRNSGSRRLNINVHAFLLMTLLIQICYVLL